MKKLLLLGLALSIGFITYAQKRNYTSISTAIPTTFNQGIDNADQPAGIVGESINEDVIYNKSGTLLKTTISTSSNVYGIFANDQRVLSARPEANLIAFGNRAGGAAGATGNDLRVSFSSNFGTTWSSVLVNSLTGRNIRYPSSVIYNPAGNTDPNNMFAIFATPATDGTNWISNYHGSIGLNGQNLDIHYVDNNPIPYINHMNIDLSVTNSGKVHVASQYLLGTTSNYTFEGWQVQNGAFNTATSKVDWASSVVTVMPVEGAKVRTDADHIVFSPDGTVGYLLGTGIDTDPIYNPYGIEWPIVYKTLDDGQTWVKIAPFDFSLISVLHQNLFPTRANPNVVIPRWYNAWVGSAGNGATVDMNGNLHIAGVVLGTLSTNPDSLAQFYTGQPHLMYDVFMNGNGTWDAQFVDTIRTVSIAAPTGFTQISDQRIRMNRTADGSKVFVTWVDSDQRTWQANPPVTTNVLPDVFIWGRDIATRHFTNPQNVTALSDYWGDNFFVHSSDMVIKQGSDYLIPVSSSTGTAEASPVTHKFLSGPSFNEGQFVNVGIGEKPKPAGSFTISPAFPNPTTGISVVKVNLEKAATLSLAVYNLTGQKLFEQNRGNVTAGAHDLTINCSGFNAGIYFYTITAGDSSVTKKLVVK